MIDVMLAAPIREDASELLEPSEMAYMCAEGVII